MICCLNLCFLQRFFQIADYDSGIQEASWKAFFIDCHGGGKNRNVERNTLTKKKSSNLGCDYRIFLVEEMGLESLILNGSLNASPEGTECEEGSSHVQTAFPCELSAPNTLSAWEWRVSIWRKDLSSITQHPY